MTPLTMLRVDAFTDRPFAGTPTCEAAFCGQATLAAAHVLITELGLGTEFRLTTRKVGTLTVPRGAEGRYRLAPFNARPLGERAAGQGRSDRGAGLRRPRYPVGGGGDLLPRDARAVPA